MIALPAGARIMLATKPVDFRKGAHSLAALAALGHAKAMFPDADVMPCVLVARRPDPTRTPPTETQVVVIARGDVDLSRLTEQVREATFPLPRTHFLRREWLLLPPDQLALFDKLNRVGVPLVQYAGVAPQYGIKTGLNEAFVIDGATRARLIAEDPASETVIKCAVRRHHFNFRNANSTACSRI